MVELGCPQGGAGVGGASRGPFPPGSPRGERVGGCGLFLSLAPAALRGIAAELGPFLFRRFLPLSLGLPCGRPGPAPSRPASRSLPCGKGRARLPGATAPAPGRARCGAGRGFAGEDPARLRHQLHCAGSGGAAGGGHSAAATAPPPSSPVPPQKNAAAATKPIAVCITSCLLLFLPAPAHPPAAGTGALCASLGWKRPSSCMGGSGREGPNLPSPQGLRGKSSCPSRPMEERRWAGKAGRGARAPSRLNDEDVVWLPAGEGGREGKRGRTAAVGGCWPGRAPVAPAGCEPPAPPAGRCPPERIPSSAGTR